MILLDLFYSFIKIFEGYCMAPIANQLCKQTRGKILWNAVFLLAHSNLRGVHITLWCKFFDQ
jgi:hypothetical protein